MKRQGRIQECCPGIGCSMEGSEVQQQNVWDDMSGKQLDSELVKLAREEEMEEVRKHKVYSKVPVQQCLEETGQMPIGTRWVDINKGDDVNWEYRSRLVAKDIKVNERLYPTIGSG